MKKKIAILRGDGIGPVLMDQAIKVIEAIAERFKHQFEYCECAFGANAIEEFGEPLPPETLKTSLMADATIIGAVGYPSNENKFRSEKTPDDGLLELRKGLDVFCNIRPIRTFKTLLHLSHLKKRYAADVDFLIYRELSSGIYFGEKGRTEDGSAAYDVCYYNKAQINRIAELAFKAALGRKQKLTLIDKANVLETSKLWREEVQLLAEKYPLVEFSTMFIDHGAAEMLMRPQNFDVILTTNLFGDILSDAAGVITGSVQLIPSASIGEKTALYEPIYSAFPKGIANFNANPIAIILSVAMMMDNFGLILESRTIRSAVIRVLNQKYGTPDLGLDNEVTANEMGDLIAAYVLDGNTIHTTKPPIVI